MAEQRQEPFGEVDTAHRFQETERVEDLPLLRAREGADEQLDRGAVGHVAVDLREVDLAPGELLPERLGVALAQLEAKDHGGAGQQDRNRGGPAQAHLARQEPAGASQDHQGRGEPAQAVDEDVDEELEPLAERGRQREVELLEARARERVPEDGVPAVGQDGGPEARRQQHSPGGRKDGGREQNGRARDPEAADDVVRGGDLQADPQQVRHQVQIGEELRDLLPALDGRERLEARVESVLDLPVRDL